jgi:L-aminopeptidase/D-esterase-like protein
MAESQPRINLNQELEPVTQFDGPTVEFDFPSVLVGIAEYDEGPTGVTLIEFANGAESVVDVRGGLPGTIMGTPEEDGHTSAICFAGGSLWGFEAITGAAAALSKRDGSYPQRVRGAIIWDFHARETVVYPDKKLGIAAAGALETGRVHVGRRGAGRSATVGKWLGGGFEAESAGQGAAFFELGELRVFALSVVNSVGGIVDREGRPVRGHLETATGKRAVLEDFMKVAPRVAKPKGNTTLTVLVINAKMSRDDLRQLSRSVHSSMARVIQPFQTESDGDVFFAATTNEIDSDKNWYELTHFASEVAIEAVLSSYED